MTNNRMEHIHDLIDALVALHDNADEDCPSKYRTKHFRNELENAFNLIDKFYTLYGTRQHPTEAAKNETTN